MLINSEKTHEHAKVFYDARYTKEGIMNSIDKNIPSFEEHLNWYSKQNLKNMYLICNGKKYVGYIRISDKNYISISLYKNECNKGYGTFALTEIVSKYKNLKAIVKKDNISSLKLFSKFPTIKVEIT